MPSCNACDSAIHPTNHSFLVPKCGHKIHKHCVMFWWAEKSGKNEEIFETLPCGCLCGLGTLNSVLYALRRVGWIE
jgi:predicted RNA-binding Zn-ribbon protein involved in translation (DUF1610 family)